MVSSGGTGKVNTSIGHGQSCLIRDRCDRILWNKSPHIESISYRRYEPTVSDHKPVSAGFKLRIKAVDPGKMVAVQREVNAEWAKKEMEVLEKMAEAYEKLL
jgi:hypothetical protein